MSGRTLTVVDDGQPTLVELAATIDREHRAAVAAADSALAHAIRAGDALLEAKRQMSSTEWKCWLTANCSVKYKTAAAYTRLAMYREVVERSGRATIGDALLHLRELPAISGGRTRNGYPEDMRIAAQQLHRDGMPHRAIADTLGVSGSTVTKWLRPESARDDARRSVARGRQRRLELLALRREDNRRRAAAAGGSVSKSYSCLRQSLQALDAARLECRGETAAALDEAIAHLYCAEDAIGRALRSAEARSA